MQPARSLRLSPTCSRVDHNEILGLIERAENVLARLEAMLPAPPPEPDWRARAFRWRKRGARAFLQAVTQPHTIRLQDLVAIDDQKRTIDENTRQFVAGLPANNVLLTGSRGTGKSSLVKAMLAKYGAKGLRLIEVDKSEFVMGSGEDVDLRLDLPLISPRHARVLWREGRHLFEDLHSARGSFRLGQPVDVRFIETGDEFDLGGFLPVRFRLV